MNRLRVLILFFAAFGFMACDNKGDNLGGDEVTQQFLSKYNGTFEEQTDTEGTQGERIVIDRDGQIEVLKLRRVGKKGDPTIPEDTVCSFILSGQIRYVVQLSDEARERVNEEGNIFLIPQTHNLVFSTQQVSLTNELQQGTVESPACQNFQEKMNQNLPTYSYGMELFISTQPTFRLHTDDESDYQGGEPTDSILNEVFVKE